MSDPTPRCFWQDDTPGQTPLHLIGGIWLCPTHARCAGCAKPLMEQVPPQGVCCVCDKYGYGGHEEAQWCSVECLEAAHPEPVEYVTEEEQP